jgi:diguanylate cyclase (GGDEF)-like protein/PAS domain S-box-containing protein
MLSRDLSTLPVQPRRWHRAAVLSALAIALVIWGALLWLRTVENRNAQTLLARALVDDAMVLEEHLARSIESVVGTAQALSLIDLQAVQATEQWHTLNLNELVLDRRLLRSISLVDQDGTVLASSFQDNVGHRVEPELRPMAQPGNAPGMVQFGLKYPRRDLVSCDDCRPELGFWAVTQDVRTDLRALRWVMAVNTGYFENFWHRMLSVHSGRSSHLLDLQGHVLAHQGGMGALPDDLSQWYRTNVLQQDAAHWQGQTAAYWQAQYRASVNWPLAVLVVADATAVDEFRSINDRRLLATGVGFSVLLSVILTAYLLWQRRYLRAVVALNNRNRAIDAHLMVSVTDSEGRIVDTNPKFCEVTGYQRDELIGQNHRILQSGQQSTLFYERFWKTLQSGQIWSGVLRNQNKRGDSYWVSSTVIPFFDAEGRIEWFVGFYSDITEAVDLRERLTVEHGLREELAAKNLELLEQAQHDPLTGVANRRAFDDFMAAVLQESRQLVQPVVLLSLDLDHFKRVNDTFGHAAGDEVLREATRRWQQMLRSSDMLARVGGEEFCIVLPSTTLRQGVLVGQKILEATNALPFSVTGPEGPVDLSVTVSVGLVAADDVRHLKTADLLEASDGALYQSKHDGRNRISTRRLVEAD